MHFGKDRQSLALPLLLLAALVLIAGLAWASPIILGDAYLPLVLQNHPTATITPTDIPLPIGNPGFELGEEDWTFSFDQGQPILVSSMAHNGSYSAGLGDGSHNRTATISQRFTVPYQETNLQYWQYVQSEELCGTYFDTLTVYLNEIVFIVYDVCENLSHDEWAKVAFNLASYAGQTIDFRMVFQSDISKESRFYVDDFSFIAFP
jgi:hypothetical protein